MKIEKLLAILVAGVLAVSMTDCAGGAKKAFAEEPAQTESLGMDQTTEMIVPVHDGRVSRILWQVAGSLAPQKGMDVNKGTAGLLYGISNGYVIVGGGANFPGDGPALGGAKKTYPDIYVLKQVDGQLVEVNHTVLGHEVGYGVSITAEGGIYYIGGSTAEGMGNKVLFVKADNAGEITADIVAELPFTFSDGFAALKDGILYVGAGKMDGSGTNRMISVNMESGDVTELAAVPNEASRTQVVSQLLGEYIYVFSGGDKVAYTDGYRYHIGENVWEQVSDVTVNGERISLLGANSVKLNEHSMLVIGGFNKEVYDGAVARMASLKGDELKEFKLNYFGADPSELKWNRSILIYDADQDLWTTIGEVPFDAPCGEALILDNGIIYSINGEIKPGTRTSRMYSGILLN